MSRHVRLAALLTLCASLTASTGCMTMSGARPLYPGQHQAGVTVGGPMVELGSPLPLPNAVIEGRSGLTYLNKRPLDLNYGLNATAIALGILQVHVGASWLLVGQRGAWPALSVTNRLFFGANILTTEDKAPGSTGAWGADQLELTASYMFGRQLVYLSLAEYLDFGAPDLLLTPALGTELDFGEKGGVKLGIEARYFAVNKRRDVRAVNWFPGSRGALGVGLGISYAFGGRCSACQLEQ